MARYSPAVLERLGPPDATHVRAITPEINRSGINAYPARPSLSSPHYQMGRPASREGQYPVTRAHSCVAQLDGSSIKCGLQSAGSPHLMGANYRCDSPQPTTQRNILFCAVRDKPTQTPTDASLASVVLADSAGPAPVYRTRIASQMTHRSISSIAKEIAELPQGQRFSHCLAARATLKDVQPMVRSGPEGSSRRGSRGSSESQQAPGTGSKGWRHLPALPATPPSGGRRFTMRLATPSEQRGRSTVRHTTPAFESQVGPTAAYLNGSSVKCHLERASSVLGANWRPSGC